MADRPIDLLKVAGRGGVVWSLSPDGFHTNLVVLEPGGSIAPHRNDDLDVLVVALAGAGSVTVDGEAFELFPVMALLVRRGTVRSITAGTDGFRYLTVHGQRAGLTIGSRRSADV